MERNSYTRWRRLSVLLVLVDHAMQGAAKLDARGLHYDTKRHTKLEYSFEGVLNRLEKKLDAELDRLTVELLTYDLEQKKKLIA